MKKILITVTNTNWIHRNNALALLKLQHERGYQVVFDLPTESPYENNLNHIVRKFIDGGFDYWLQIDSDNAPTMNPLDLVELNKDIMLLPYLQWHCTSEDLREGNYPICTLIMDDVGEGFKEHKNMSGLQKVDAGGSGCMLIARRVLEVMPPFTRTHDKHGRVVFGVDFNFCREARKKGFEVWCHYDYPVEHFKTLPLMEVQTAFSNFYAKKYSKKESSGEDLVFFCGPTREKWDGETHLGRGIAGSEEAVIYLVPELAKLGWNVTVYNNCVAEKVINGVTWKPYHNWNRFDKQDITILWRCPGLSRQRINSDKICVDLHDVPQHPEELKGLPLDRIFVKGEYQRSLYEGIDDSKFAIIPNGINFSQYVSNDEERDPFLLFNTSNPIRSLGTLIQLFLRVKKRVPQAKLAWAYGWSWFDDTFKNDKKMMNWKAYVLEAMKVHGIYNLDRVTHEEIVQLSKKARIWAYPTTFPELGPISALKAQAGGAIPVTTDAGGLQDYVDPIAVELPTEDVGKRNDYDFGITDERMCQDWVDEVVRVLLNPIEVSNQKFEKYDWSNIASMWDVELDKLLRRVI